MKRTILNVAVGKWYPRGQQRLGKSLDRFGEDADRLFLADWPTGPRHEEVPYGFKVSVFHMAERRGAELCLWIDSSCWQVRSFSPVWAQIKRDGYLLGQEGWTVGQWCNDEALALVGKTREEANEITLVEGKFLGLDLTHKTGREFLDRWQHYRDLGVFNGSWENHRHDITAAGFIAHDMGLTLTPHLIEFDSKRLLHPDVFVRASGM